jgi:CheY-like chemotaxis protein
MALRTSLFDDQETGFTEPLLLVGSTAAICKSMASRKDSLPDFVLENTWTPEDLLLRVLKITKASVNPQKVPAITAKQTIVIADDDFSITSLLSALFSKAGFDTRTAADGVGALELAWNLKPDLMIVDVNMPNRDGFEVLSIIRQFPALCAIKVTMLTSCEEERDILHGFGLGVDDYVTKPFNPMELSARVKSVLTRT